jgi:hypothetical protein
VNELRVSLVCQTCVRCCSVSLCVSVRVSVANFYKRCAREQALPAFAAYRRCLPVRPADTATYKPFADLAHQHCCCYNFDVAMPAGAARSPRRTSRAFLDDATAFPPPLIDATGVIGCKPDWISTVALQ